MSMAPSMHQSKGQESLGIGATNWLKELLHHNPNISNLQIQRSEIRFITSLSGKRHTLGNGPSLLWPYPCSTQLHVPNRC